MAWSSIDLAGADVSFATDWLQPAQADALLADLSLTVPWGVHRIKLFGRAVDSPRLSCWIGDPDAAYTYSGTRFEPHPWPEALVPIRHRLANEIGTDFNSVLANLYRDGADCMGWHSDNEAALGAHPAIASLSLGATRRFVFKHRNGQPFDSQPFDSQPFDSQRTGSKRIDGKLAHGRLALELPHGSLLLMRGDTQRNYRHALPRTAKPTGARVNLTFRRVG